ncbi:hypothetical protein TCAL_01443 [Tigriopus californicus]|uniref:BZIP domain-containing protein n=1 Tax=Tigriopus californicus TaxID=6832 RepID=A0A553N6H1_TIGCA|nr:CCAAT/enhancer-binding protein-like [Tigriopus californicus]TRY61035.1 hypothetical protein TCAL_01443 [Tigriopus californicus]
MESSPHMYDPNTHQGNNGGTTSPMERPLTKGGPCAPAAYKVKHINHHGGVPGAPGTTEGVHGGGDLAELASSEISLDLQGLIDDHNFGEENIFGDDLNHGYGLPHRTSPNGSIGSSGQSSPGQESPQSFQQYRNTLAYLPGSVHSGAASYNTQIPPVSNNPSQSGAATSVGPGGINTNIQVKQEPVDGNSGHGASANHASFNSPNSNNSSITNSNAPANNNTNNTSAYSNGTVSSTTPGPPHHPALASNHNNSSGGYPTVLPSLKSFSQAPKYLQASSNIPLHMSKKRVDRNSDEYRRRRERNNVAVRKSREKAKERSRMTEERVKILARENERLQKKVELLQEELTVLRSLFSNVGVLPEHIHRELSKHMDNFQQQHNAMACM